MRLRSMVLVIVLISSACSLEGEALLDAFVGSIVGEKPLISPDNSTDVRAAGSTVDENEADKGSQSQIRRALKPNKTTDDKIKHAENAIADRPGDPLYYLHLSRFLLEAGHNGSAWQMLVRAKGLVYNQYAHIQDPDKRAMETERRFLEINMEATLGQYRAAPAGSEEQKDLKSTYCSYRTSYSDSNYRTGFLGSAYWDFTLYHSICQ